MNMMPPLKWMPIFLMIRVIYPTFWQKLSMLNLVIGSRYIPGGSTPNWSWGRRLISGFGNLFARTVLVMPVHDCTAGFRCYRRQVLENIGLDTIESQGYGFQVELAYRVQKYGFKIVETPIVFMDRRVGKSKMSRSIVFEAFTYVVRARFKKLPPPTRPILENTASQSTSGTSSEERPYSEQTAAGRK